MVPIAPTNNTIFIDTLTYGFTGPRELRTGRPGHRGMRDAQRQRDQPGTLHVFAAANRRARLEQPDRRRADRYHPVDRGSVQCRAAGGAAALPVVDALRTGLEVLNTGPWFSAISVLGNYDVGVPCAVDLIGTQVISQGLRFERRSGVDHIVPLNALDATVGYCRGAGFGTGAVSAAAARGRLGRRRFSSPPSPAPPR